MGCAHGLHPRGFAAEEARAPRARGAEEEEPRGSAEEEPRRPLRAGAGRGGPLLGAGAERGAPLEPGALLEPGAPPEADAEADAEAAQAGGGPDETRRMWVGAQALPGGLVDCARRRHIYFWLGSAALLTALCALAAVWLDKDRLGGRPEVRPGARPKGGPSGHWHPGRETRLADMGVHRWGVNIHLHHSTDGGPSEMAALAKAFRTVRTDLFWHRVEKVRGVFKFQRFDDLVVEMRKNGIQPVFILCYGNEVYGCPDHPRNDSCQEAFANYAVTSMRHFAGNGIIWEMYNEPNLGWAQLKEEAWQEYSALVNRLMQRVRSDPAISNEIVIGPGTSGVDIEFITATGNVGGLDWFDGISAHPYRREIPETVLDSWTSLRIRLQGYPKVAQLPLICSEWGWATCSEDGQPHPCPRGGAGTGDLISEEEQAARLARQWLIHDRKGISFSIWYDWRNDGFKPMDTEDNFGTTYYGANYTTDPSTYSKPSYIAAMALQSVLGSLVYVEDACRPPASPASSGLFCLRYRNRNDPGGLNATYAVWGIHSDGGLETVSIFPTNCMRVIDMLGQKTSRKICPGTAADGLLVEMHVSTAPVYLVAAEDEADWPATNNEDKADAKEDEAVAKEDEDEAEA